MLHFSTAPYKGYVLMLCFTLLSIVQHKTYAQAFAKDYVPNHNYRPEKQTLNEVSAIYSSSLSRVASESKQTRKGVKESLEELSDNIVQLDSFRLLMHTDTLTGYLNRLTERIQAANPSLQGKKYYIFTLRSNTPNASNRGDGIIVVNLDMIRRARTEAELVFILCHEMSHDAEGHVMDGLLKRAQVFNGSYKKEVKKAGSKEYERNKAVLDVYSQHLAKYNSYRRGHEYLADSLGIMLYSNLGYPFEDAVNIIELMDSVDRPYYTRSIDLKKHFGFPSAPFNDEWLDPGDHKDILGSNVEGFLQIPDSLKTHPECKLRSQALVRIILEQRPGKDVPDAINIGNYAYYKTLAEFEIIEALTDAGEVGLALYHALQLLEEYPQNLYLHSTVTNCLFEISSAQAQHRFSDVVGFPDRSYPLAYNKLLILLHNFSQKELRSLMDNYCTARVAPAASENAFAAYVTCLVQSINKSQAECIALAAMYEQQHTDKYYRALLNKKLQPTSEKNK